MTTDITTANQGGAVALSNLRNSLSKVRGNIKTGGGAKLLRLLKDGEWVYGANDEPVGNGTEAVLNVMSIKHGYSCWTNRGPGEGKNKLMGEILQPLGTDLPMVHELEEKHDPDTGALCQWRDQMVVDVKLIGGEQLLWKISSVGGLNAMADIMDAVMLRIDTGTEFVLPIVAFDVDSYRHSQYGKTYVPKLEIVGWANAAGEEEGADAPAAIEEAPKEAPEELANEEAPRRRRRAS